MNRTTRNSAIEVARETNDELFKAIMSVLEDIKTGMSSFAISQGLTDLERSYKCGMAYGVEEAIDHLKNISKHDTVDDE